MKTLNLTLIALLFLTGAALRANVSCPAIFSDHMVLQRERPDLVWGEADPGETVTVTFASQVKSAVAAPDGQWRVALDPMPASAESRALTIRGRNTLSFSDVLVGEVWLCSGQSNMEKPLGPRKGQKPTDNYQAETAAANHPLLRLFQMPHYGKFKKNSVRPRWLPCTPETIQSTDFSAAAYYFGREVQRALGVPVGLIHSSFGGTQIEAWIPPEGFARNPDISALAHTPYFAWVKGVQATDLYESMIAPLAPYTLRGFLWYQGETNCMNADGPIYTEKMRALIESWRAVWHDPSAPFYYVQIAPFDYSQWPKWHLTPEALPVFWAAQTAALAIPHTGMVVITDLAGSARDIHPTDKLDVGLRLARLALADTYGRPGPVARSPRFASMRALSGRKLALNFTHCGAGLVARDGLPLDEFQIAGADHRFFPATAVIAGDTVTVSSPEVAQPVAVHFAWSETANPALTNSAGLPAISFRTDDWPVVTQFAAAASSSSSGH